MFTGKTIGFIGAGNMGGAMIGGLVRGGSIAGGQIIAADVDAGRLESLRQAHGIQTASSNDEAAQAHILIISVKPQILPMLKLNAAHCDFVLSIVAGATIAQIGAATGSQGVVRCMPNTPAMIGEGMTVWTAAPEVGTPQRQQAAAILKTLGEEIYVDQEKLLDAATAVSGSGPAYVFLILEAMIDEAVHLGFSREQARKLVLQTVKGAALYAQHSGQHEAALRNQVTSPAGTTAEALYYMEQLGLRHALARGIRAAYDRSRELGS